MKKNPILMNLKLLYTLSKMLTIHNSSDLWKRGIRLSLQSAYGESFTYGYSYFEFRNVDISAMHMDYYHFRILSSGEVYCSYKNVKVLDDVPYKEFMSMDDDTKFQYCTLYPDYDLYHEVFCFIITKGIYVDIESNQLQDNISQLSEVIGLEL